MPYKHWLHYYHQIQELCNMLAYMNEIKNLAKKDTYAYSSESMQIYTHVYPKVEFIPNIRFLLLWEF